MKLGVSFGHLKVNFMLKKNITQRRKDDAEKNKKRKFSSTLEAIYEFYPSVQLDLNRIKTYRIPQKKHFAYPLRPFDKAQDRLCDFACAFISVLYGSGFAGLGKELNIR